jgi:hypothetical protein
MGLPITQLLVELHGADRVDSRPALAALLRHPAHCRFKQTVLPDGLSRHREA